VDATGTKLIPIIDCREGVWGIKPRNREQHFASTRCSTTASSSSRSWARPAPGKTLLAMAAGLKRVVNDREFRRLVVARPTISMGKELGFLPGSLEEKLAPWMQPIHDALEMLSDLNMGHDHRRSGDLMRSGSIVVEALSYIRGRSIANQFMIIDEAQNLTPLEAKTIITRVGSGTKIIFTGDPYQIDNPYVDSSSNGFNYIVSRFRAEAIAAHIELQKGERSELAELAANIL
jgi:PhoH-like ATPase